MADYILLKDSKVCPNCRRKDNIQHLKVCHHCGTMLFLHEINFRYYEECGELRNYWLFTRGNGWMHRDQIMVRQEAQIANPKIVTPEPNRKFNVEEIQKRGGKITKAQRQKLLARANA